ncbi:MAG: HupE/UreJ family protein [Gammaproteobacteria bacterium]
MVAFDRNQWSQSIGISGRVGPECAIVKDLGLPQDALLRALFGFNLGVEIGQLAIVAAFLPLAYLLRRWWLYPRLAVQLGSIAIVFVAAIWFGERAFRFTPFWM